MSIKNFANSVRLAAEKILYVSPLTREHVKVLKIYLENLECEQNLFMKEAEFGGENGAVAQALITSSWVLVRDLHYKITEDEQLLDLKERRALR